MVSVFDVRKPNITCHFSFKDLGVICLISVWSLLLSLPCDRVKDSYSARVTGLESVR